MSQAICLKCPRVQPPPHAGSCVCLEDGNQTAAHADAAFCPLAKFGTSTAPAGWVSITIDPSKFGKPPEQKPHEPLKPVPREEWKIVARSVARLAREGDKGLGDIVERCAKIIGGDYYKRIYKRITGEDCGCADRREKLNQLYPL